MVTSYTASNRIALGYVRQYFPGVDASLKGSADVEPEAIQAGMRRTGEAEGRRD